MGLDGKIDDFSRLFVKPKISGQMKDGGPKGRMRGLEQRAFHAYGDRRR